MSVIVKGMKMPKYCKECSNHYWFAGRIWCYYLDDSIDGGENTDVSHPHNCPIIPLPEKHGRLIDGDYLYDRLKALGLKDENVFRIIKEEPTVIESEE